MDNKDYIIKYIGKHWKRHETIIDEMLESEPDKTNGDEFKIQAIEIINLRDVLKYYHKGYTEKAISENTSISRPANFLRDHNIDYLTPPKRLSMFRNILKYYLNGLNQRQIGEKVGLYWGTIHLIFKNRSVKYIEPTRRPSTIKKILDLYAKGLNQEQIGQKLGVTYTVISRYFSAGNHYNLSVRYQNTIKRPSLIKKALDLYWKGLQKEEISQRINLKISELTKLFNGIKVKYCKPNSRVSVLEKALELYIIGEKLENIFSITKIQNIQELFDNFKISLIKK